MSSTEESSGSGGAVLFFFGLAGGAAYLSLNPVWDLPPVVFVVVALLSSAFSGVMIGASSSDDEQLKTQIDSANKEADQAKTMLVKVKAELSSVKKKLADQTRDLNKSIAEGIRNTNRENLKKAVDELDFPYLLFPSTHINRINDLKLKFVDVEFNRNCDITSDNGIKSSGCFSTIRLNNNDLSQVLVFLRLLEATFLEIPSKITNEKIRKEIVNIADLFRRADEGRNDIVGLWGELFIIQKAQYTLGAVTCWTCNPRSKYDFVSNRFLLEVKTTLRSTRTHRFSIDQIRTPLKQKLYVASILLLEIPSGKSVGKIIDEICGKIKDNKIRKTFLETCLLKGGKRIYSSNLKLGEYPKNSSLVIIEAKNIPAPNVNINDPITNVRFNVELTGIIPIEEIEQSKLLEFNS